MAAGHPIGRGQGRRRWSVPFPEKAFRIVGGQGHHSEAVLSGLRTWRGWPVSAILPAVLCSSWRGAEKDEEEEQTAHHRSFRK